MYTLITSLLLPLLVNGMLFTFDDGPRLSTTPTLLDTLKKHNVKAVFCIPVYNLHDPRKLKIAKRIVKEGHIVCNHSMTHSLFNRISERRQVWEILKAQREFRKYLGITPKLFRPPGGVITRTMRRVLREHGIKLLYWDLSTEDWRRATTKEHIYSRAVNGWKKRRARGKTSIVLFHDTNKKTLSVIERIINRVQTK